MFGSSNCRSGQVVRGRIVQFVCREVLNASEIGFVGREILPVDNEIGEGASVDTLNLRAAGRLLVSSNPGVQAGHLHQADFDQRLHQVEDGALGGFQQLAQLDNGRPFLARTGHIVQTAPHKRRDCRGLVRGQ